MREQEHATERPDTADRLAVALGVAQTCGVTRLADITRLDCLGVPVFQAVRPLGRALSVHQGKGLSEQDARIGALMEAIESDHAETFEGETRTCAWDDLAADQRSPALDDFAADRARSPGPEEPLVWVRAERIADAGPCWAPHEVVSLDFTRRGDVRLERSSNGLGAGFDRDAATLTALLEVIERDATEVWRAASRLRRSSDRVAVDTIPFDWFKDVLARIRSAGLRLAVYSVRAVVDIPVFVCELAEPEAGPAPRRRLIGSACRPAAEEALARSLVEAAQARLTAISGVRDDILPGLASPGSEDSPGLGFPLSSRSRLLDWSNLADRSAPAVGNALRVTGLLAGAGYPGAALVDLSRSGCPVSVVKAMVPGLANGDRVRRIPIGPAT